MVLSRYEKRQSLDRTADSGAGEPRCWTGFKDKKEGAVDCLRLCGVRIAVLDGSLSLALHSDPPRCMNEPMGRAKRFSSAAHARWRFGDHHSLSARSPIAFWRMTRHSRRGFPDGWKLGFRHPVEGNGRVRSLSPEMNSSPLDRQQGRFALAIPLKGMQQFSIRVDKLDGEFVFGDVDVVEAAGVHGEATR